MRAFLDVPEMAATANHLVTVQRTLDRLQRAKVESWDQMLDIARRLYHVGTLTVFDLEVMYDEMANVYGPGWSTAWDRVMPIKANSLRWAVERERRGQPNGPAGSWMGVFPLGAFNIPPKGRAVVYVLFDAENEPVYVGSTGNFRERMKRHLKDKQGLATWVAYPCRDREHAYEMEVELLTTARLRMNKKASR